MSTPAPAAQTKTCSTCGHTRPLDMFGRSAGRKDGRYPRCRPCRAVARRQGADITPPRLCDPAPAVRLRHELVAARRAGQTFETAWPPAVQVALDTVSVPRERRSWETALASTKGAWASAYCREVALAGHAAVGTLAEAA